MMEIWPNAGAAKVEAASRVANNQFTFIVLLRALMERSLKRNGKNFRLVSKSFFSFR
jgi:hypothetical protein